MRSFRVFNDVKDVRIVWKLAGLRLGPYGQIAVMLLGSLCLLLLPLGLIVPSVVFVLGFIAIAIYAVILSRIDETGALSERTQLRLLRGGMKRRHTNNFDLPAA